MVAWMGSLPSSMKFDFLGQPSEVVLSVIESAQSPFCESTSNDVDPWSDYRCEVLEEVN
jgi:hypothetical protein